MRVLSRIVCLAAVSGLVCGFVDQQFSLGQARPAVEAGPRGSSPASGETPLEQLSGELEAARLAASRGDVELSLTSMRRALERGTVLIGPAPAGQAGVPVGTEAIQERIADRLQSLSVAWTEHQFPPGRVYDALLPAILPDGNPAAVRHAVRSVLRQPLQGFSFSLQTSADVAVPDISSAGQVLSEWAVKADQEQDLRKRLTLLADEPTTRWSAEVLLGQLALAERDQAGVSGQLARIGELLAEITPPDSADMACLVALPALADDATRGAASDLLNRVIQVVQPSFAAEGNNISRLAALTRIQARTQFALGRAEQGRASLDRFLAVNRVMNNLFGGDYPQFLQRQQLGVVVFELLRAGDVPAALARLAELVDLPVSQNYGERAFGRYGPTLARKLMELPAEQRYRLLRDFTFPAEGRGGLRLVTEFVPVDHPPIAFAAAGVPPENAFRLSTCGDARDIFSTGSLLIQTARDVKALAELRTSLTPLAEQGQPGATELLALLDLEEGHDTDAIARVQNVATALTNSLSDDRQRQRPPYPMLTHLVAVEAGRFASLRPVAEGMLVDLVRYTQLIQDDLPRAHARWSLDLLRRAPHPEEEEQEAFAQSWPLHWIAAGIESAAQHSAGSLPSVWVAQEGVINKLAGPDQSYLYFRYPLTGNFEVYVDATDGGWNEGNLMFGGVTMNVAGYRKGVTFLHLGERNNVRLENVPWLFSGRFNRQGVRVSGSDLQFRANGHPLHSEKVSGSPWLGLNADSGRTPAFANLRITGQPVIPREVPLLPDDRLTGWIADFYGETRPDPFPDASERARRPGRLEDLPGRMPDYDWYGDNGVLYGRRMLGLALGPLQSRVYYHRPILDGEQVHYQFFYEPHVTEAHPTLGRLTFLLEPAGVALHWLTDGDADASGLPADNRIELPDERRGPTQLPLIAGEWNRVTLAVADGVARLQLNDVDVYERVLDPANGRQFGFYHDRSRTALRVRNPVLTGNWPERLTPELLAGIRVPANVNPPQADSRALNVIIGEDRWASQAYQVYQQSLALPPAERYAFLRDWVLPGPNHDTIRTYAAATPTNPAPPASEVSRVDVTRLQEKLADQTRRIQTGGNLVAPAIELVRVAAELHRLDELADRLDKVVTPTLFHTRSRIALLAVTALADEKPEDALNWMIELFALARQQRVLALDQRWADLIAADAAIRSPVTRDVAIDLMDLIVRQQLQPGRTGSMEFDAQVRRIRGTGWALREGTAPGRICSTPLTQWTIVSQSRAATNGSGCPTPHWQGRPGQLLHYVPHETDAVYFQSPLQGDYRIDCRLSAFGFREAHLVATGLWTRLRFTRDQYELGEGRIRRPNVPLPQTLPSLSNWYNYRLAVDNGVYSSFVDGQPLHTEQLPAAPDPWVQVDSPPVNFGGVRELSITGSPTIPDAIDLLSVADLSNWTDYYDALPGATENSGWRIAGDELVDDQQPQLAGQHVERLLRYHRPLLEDGQLEYDFWYEPGVVEAHPALDRIAFLLAPSGIRLHWATDAQYDRTGLQADNVQEEREYRRGPAELPLRAGEWNRMKLTTAGDSVSLVLNGVEVYQRPIEPTNLRFFGLFHFADQSTLRVRNVVYRGAWPRELPEIERQEMAVNPAGEPESETDRPAQEFAIDFRDASFDPRALIIGGNFLGKYVFPEAAGLRMSLPARTGKPNGVGVGTSFGLRGDFDILARFEGLAVTPPAEAWGAGIELDARFKANYDHRTQLELRAYPGGQRVVSAALHDRHVDGSSAYQKDDFFMLPQAGTLWLARRQGMMRYAFAPESSTEFQLLSERYVGHDDVSSAQARIVSSDAVGGADVTWKSLVVRANEFLFDARTEAPPLNYLKIDLSREPLGGLRLQVPEPGGPNFVQRTRAGVWMRTPPEETSPFGVRAWTTGAGIDGDFEITAEFRLAQLTAPESGYGAGVQLWLELADPEQRMLHLCRRAYPDGRQGLAVHNVWQAGGSRHDDSLIVPSFEMAGQLRIARRGERVTWSFAPAGSDQFDEIKSADAGRSPIQRISLFCESSHPASGVVDVTWSRLSIRAAGISR